MAITVGSLTLKQLQELPFTHSGDSLTGQTARRWPVKAVVTPSEWLTLDGIYNTWRTSRLADPDTMVSLSVGSTVNTSGSLYGMSWSNVGAWFSAPPVPTATGAMISVAFELVDATQQLAAMLRGQALSTEVQDNESTYGTYTLGTVTLNLTASLEAYEDGPTAELAATGTHVIKGALAASRLRKVQGWTHTSGAGATVRSWYESQVATKPAAGAWWPISPPTTEQKPVIVSGARVTRHLISAELKEIR
jgi:hypothetical protein